MTRIHRSIALICAAMTLGAEVGLSQDDSTAPRFRPRTDANAQPDVNQLRELLAKSADARGPVNPLANYVVGANESQRSGPSNAINQENRRANPNDRLSDRDQLNNSDSEADQSPTLTQDDRARIREAQLEANRKGTLPVALLPAPRVIDTNVTTPRLVSSNYVDGFRAARFIRSFADDPEATTRPGLSSPVQFASAIGTDDGAVRIANYQDPVANTPPTLGSTGAFPPSGGTITNPVPGAFPSGANGIGLPSSNITMPAPAPYSLPNNAIGAPVTGAPMTNGLSRDVLPNSPSNLPSNGGYAAPTPTYPRNTGLVNSSPFVSDPPCQFDASYMVSPTVYRQATGCDTPSRGTGVPYAGGSPFAYVPPTMMPYPSMGNNGGFRPLIGFGQNAYNAQVGRGIIGQPTAYVNGQPIRNFLRYIFP